MSDTDKDPQVVCQRPVGAVMGSKKVKAIVVDLDKCQNSVIGKVY